MVPTRIGCLLLLVAVARIVTASYPVDVVQLWDEDFERRTQAASGQTTGVWCAQCTLPVFNAPIGANHVAVHISIRVHICLLSGLCYLQHRTFGTLTASMTSLTSLQRTRRSRSFMPRRDRIVVLFGEIKPDHRIVVVFGAATH